MPAVRVGQLFDYDYDQFANCDYDYDYDYCSMKNLDYDYDYDYCPVIMIMMMITAL